MRLPARRSRPGADLISRRSVYIIGLLSAVKALGLVLVAESIARGIAAMAAGEPEWRNALLLGVVAAGVRSAASWATTVAAARAAIGTKEDLRARLAAKLVDGSSGTGSMATLATRGLDDLDEYFLTVLPATSAAAVIPLLIGARIFVADWPSVVIILVTVPLIPVFMALVGQYTQAKSDAAASALDRLSNHIVELARGLPVLVGLGRMQEQARSLRTISDDYRTTTMRTLRTAFLSSLVLELISTISVALVAVFVGIRILGGGLTLQTGLVVLILAPECYAPFRDLGAAYHSSRSGRTALARVNGILSMPARAAAVARQGASGVARLTIAFAGRDAPILHELTFALPPVGVTALVGPSGSGKSTLLRVLAGRLAPDCTITGEVFVDDPSAVGWAPQHPRTVAATVRGELALYSEGVTDGQLVVARLLAELGLSSVAEADPAQLSPGELRRLAVARAALRVEAGAHLVLLDEPTAHLDDTSAAAVIDLIRRVGARASVVVASHDAAVTALADTRIQLGAAGPQRARDTVAMGGQEVAVTTPADAPGPIATTRTFGALVAFMRPATGRYLGAGALGTLASAFAIALTTVSAWLIVRAGEHPAIMYLLVAIVGVRFFGLGRAALRYCERLVTHDAVFFSATELRMRLWGALARTGATSRKLQRGGTALDLLVAATDDVRDLVPRVYVPAVVGVAIGVGAIATAWLVLPASAGVIVGILTVSLVLAPALALLADRRAEAGVQVMRSTVLRGFAALLDAADDLKGNCVDSFVRADLAAADVRIGRAARRTASSRGLGAATVILAGCLGAMAMLAVGAPAVASGALAVELEAVLVLLPIALIDPLLGFVAAIQHIPALKVALARTAALDATQPARHGVIPVIHSIAPIRELVLDSLAATWPGAGAPAFSNVTGATEAGHWLVVEGRSGSGKSTLLTVLLGSLAPSRGAVLLDATAEVDVDPTELHRHIVWCPQDAHLFDSTLRGNLLLGRRRDDPPTDHEMVAALQVAGLGALLNALPEGLDTRVGTEGSRLSGGERQRVAVARTVLSRAEVVLLDEPTAHLDQDTAVHLMADLRLALRDRLVVLVTHHANEVRAGDDLVLIGSRPLVAV